MPVKRKKRRYQKKGRELYDLTPNAEGNVTLSIPRQQKRIRDALGHWRTLVTFDGISWVLKGHEDAEKLRLHRAANLLGGDWNTRRKAEFRARFNPGTLSEPKPLLVRVERQKESITKKKGKSAKYRRNLRARVPTAEPQLRLSGTLQPKTEKRINEHFNPKTKPSHIHICRHCQAEHICSCSTPYLRKKCGGKVCLRAIHLEESLKCQLQQQKGKKRA